VIAGATQSESAGENAKIRCEFCSVKATQIMNDAGASRNHPIGDRQIVARSNESESSYARFAVSRAKLTRLFVAQLRGPFHFMY
jgi:hypothetical protein